MALGLGANAVQCHCVVMVWSPRVPEDVLFDSMNL